MCLIFDSERNLRRHRIMTKARSQQSRRTRRAGSADACEMLLAELQASRLRVHKLLRLVSLEVQDLPLRHAGVRCRAHRQTLQTNPPA